jgi:cell division protein FtsI/penicillin-binding protein 2
VPYAGRFFGLLLGTLPLADAVAAPEAINEELTFGPAFSLSPDSVRIHEDSASARLSDGTRADLTLDVALQRAAGKLLRNARPVAGAALLLDVATGRLLVYEQFTRPGRPVYDVLTSEAPTASIFKLVTTAALFEHGSIEPSTPVCFAGGQREITRDHLDAPAPHHARCAPFGSALGHSRNAVYAQVVTQHLTRSDLLETGERLGFNALLPFDAEARVGTLRLPYNDLEFAQAAAGFRSSSVSPLGATHISYAIALGGQSARMRLVDAAGDYRAPRTRTLRGQVMSANTAWRLTRMMEVTVHSGTSLEAFSNPMGTSYLGSIRVAGKTGTLKARPDSPTTSWFTGFAPSRKPKVVVTVMLQNDDIWRSKANELARDLLRSYFQGAKGVTDPFASDSEPPSDP